MKNRNPNLILNLVLVLTLLGPLGLAATAADAAVLQAEAAAVPWSGWWWPKNKGSLVLGYNGRPSPAEKYDLYTGGRRPGQAYYRGLQEWYDPQALNWIGFCNGWVNAAILEPQPILPSSRNGVFLTVGDKKGLLAACHVEDEILYEYCQQSPEPFHRYLLKYIGERGEMIGADLDSSSAFWSYPIYRYEMEVTSGQVSDQIVCTIWHADDFVEPDYQGTKVQSRTYVYRLDKNSQGHYSGGGAWLQGDPGELHPQSVWIPIGVRRENLFVDYDRVVEMAQSVGDELENENLVPGHHLLVVYPREEDFFRLTPLEGERFSCALALDPQSAPGNTAHYQIEKNGLVTDAGELDSTLRPLTLCSTAVGGEELLLRILPGAENWAGVCVHLYVGVEAPYQSWLYGLPARQYWSGYAVVADERAAAGERVWLEMIGNQGLPFGRGAVSGNQLDLGGRWLGLVDNQIAADYFKGEAVAQAVKLVSRAPFQILSLSGDSRKLWGPPAADLVTSGGRLVVPWLTSASNMQRSATVYLANQGAEAQSLRISYFKNDGTPRREAVLELPPATVFKYACGEYPAQQSLDGWALLEDVSPAVSGAVIAMEGINLADQLPLLAPARSQLAPHLAADAGWQSNLGLCNPNEAGVRLTMTAWVDGAPLPLPHTLNLPAFAARKLQLSGALFGVGDEVLSRAWLQVEGDREYAAYLSYRYGDEAEVSIPLGDDGGQADCRRLAHLAVCDGWWTGIVLLNQAFASREVVLSVLDAGGEVLESLPLHLGPREKLAHNVAGLFTTAGPEAFASLHLEGAAEVKALALYGGLNGVTQLTARSW
ncbi:MAG TPA: hypothetical protein ENN66_05400 [Proteobacteria bacterium]|nr:hypothetical protein [Pseudomonadota bacterium]